MKCAGCQFGVKDLGSIKIAHSFDENCELTARPVDDTPLYGEIMLTRFRDKVIVTCAPTVALIDPGVLFHDRAVGVRVHRDMIEIADQATYRITGWDQEHRSLIVLLEKDHR